MKLLVLMLVVAGTVLAVSDRALARDALDSWRDGESRRRLVDFVEQTTDPTDERFVPEAERIAVFDNDGTLWSERPVYFQLLFAMDRVRERAADHPEWRTTQPFKAVLEGDVDSLAAQGEHAILELVMATHAGMTTEEFEHAVEAWLAEARHPTTGLPYTSMVYEPMLELLAYLRANGFKTFIVTGGGIEFLRVFSEEVYGVPPEQVVGSGIKTRYETRDGEPVLVKLPEIDFVDDKAGKPVGIQRYIGRRPILAFGNSDGDFEMLEWTTSGEGPRLGLLLHHTDAEREWAYDRESPVGRLDRGLAEAAARGWVVVDMEDDWRVVYPSK